MKVSRHAKIVELINQYNIETQEELAEQLNKAGFQVTQATVSRDIRDLRLTESCGGKWKTEVCDPSGSGKGYEGKIHADPKRRVCFDGDGTKYTGSQNRIRNGDGGRRIH